VPVQQGAVACLGSRTRTELPASFAGWQPNGGAARPRSFFIHASHAAGVSQAVRKGVRVRDTLVFVRPPPYQAASRDAGNDSWPQPCGQSAQRGVWSTTRLARRVALYCTFMLGCCHATRFRSSVSSSPAMGRHAVAFAPPCSGSCDGKGDGRACTTVRASPAAYLSLRLCLLPCETPTWPDSASCTRCRSR
jgi:hypothetical protein